MNFSPRHQNGEDNGKDKGGGGGAEFAEKETEKVHSRCPACPPAYFHRDRYLHAEDSTSLETDCILVGASSGSGYASRDCKVDPEELDPGECLCDHFLCGDGVTCVSPNKL